MALTTRSSARVLQYWPFSPARPNGVRTPSTKTTSRTVRGTVPPWASMVRIGNGPSLLAGNNPSPWRAARRS